MEFTCNPIKNETNILTGACPCGQRGCCNSRLLVREDTRKAYPERRFIGYNTIDERLMVVVFCAPADDHIHIISFRKANRREQTKFENKTL